MGEGRKKEKEEGRVGGSRKGGEREKRNEAKPCLKKSKAPYLMDRLQQDIPLRGRYEKERIIALYKFAIIETPTSGSANSSHKQH